MGTVVYTYHFNMKTCSKKYFNQGFRRGRFCCRFNSHDYFQEGIKRKRRRHSTVCAKPWLSRRSELGVYNTLLQELRLEEEFEYKSF